MSQRTGALTDNRLTSNKKFRLCEHGVSAGLGAAPVLPSMLQEDVPDHQVHRGGLLQKGGGKKINKV